MVVGVCFIVYFNLRVTLSCLLLPLFFEAMNPATEAPFSLYNFLFFKIFFDNKVLLMCCLMVLVVYDLGTKMTAHNLGLWIGLFVVCFSYLFMYNAFYKQEEDNSKTALAAVVNLVRSPKPSGDCENGEKIPKAPSMLESMFGGFANMFSSKRRKEDKGDEDGLRKGEVVFPAQAYMNNQYPGASASLETDMGFNEDGTVQVQPGSIIGLSNDKGGANQPPYPEGRVMSVKPPPPPYEEHPKYVGGRPNKKPSIKEKALKSRRKVNIK
jgi:hypothetical protein